MNRNPWTTRAARALLFAAALLLASCGGSGDDSTPDNTIGAAGGTATGPNGTRVVVPAGALSAPVVITFTPVAAQPVPAGLQALGQLYSLGPAGTTFAVPVTVTLPLDPTQLPAGARLRMLHELHGSGGDTWEELPGLTVAATSASAQTTSFSHFTLASGLPPQITVQPSDTMVVEPAAASFSVTAIGTPPFTYRWQRSDDAGTNFVDVPGATASAYTTGATSVAADHDDRYRVLVSNVDGTSTSSVARLTVTAVIVTPTITAQPQSLTVAAGGNASFSVVATGSNLVYQWQRTGQPLNGQTNASLNLANVQAGDAASYTVVVSNLVNGAAVNSVTSNAATLTLGAPPPGGGTASRISAGDFFSVAVNAAGVPYTWGVSGVLGNGATTDRPTAAPVGGFNAVRSVAGGSIAAMAIRTDGTLWAWGYRGSIDCQFGVSAPTPFQITGASNVASVSMGASHTLLLGSDGVVRALGCNFAGELGRSGTASATTPVAVAGLPAGIAAVAAAGTLSLALDGAGNVWAWGTGALGDGTPFATSRFTPMQVPGVTGVTAIAAGDGFALALKSDGSVWAWGRNINGRLGDGSETDRLTPVATLLTSQITAIAAGDQNGLALRNDGVVLSWGINETGQLGSGSSSPGYRPQPAAVVGLTSVVAIDFGPAGGLGHAVALKSDGTVWSWGWNSGGQLGNGTSGPSTFATSPVQVSGLNLN